MERRNALLRAILEKLIDQFAAHDITQCHTLLTAACHALNSGIYTHGRSAYQAVFGRVPRLPDSTFSDPMVFATSTPVAHLEHYDPAFKAEVIRAEAMKTLHDLDVNQHLRRALLRRTRVTKVADLQPGQRCAFWRWQRRGPKKRGSWITARFLSWDPSHVGKQAWVRAQGGTTLVTAEQLRAAVGFEQWTPDKADIKSLRDASRTIHEQLVDERGPQPDELQDRQPEDREILPADEFDPIYTPSLAVPETPTAAAPATPAPQQPTVQQQQEVTTTVAQQAVNINIDSPTHVTNQTLQQHFHRFGDLPTPRTPRTTRGRSRTPSKGSRAQPAQIASTDDQHGPTLPLEQQVPQQASSTAISPHVSLQSLPAQGSTILASPSQTAAAAEQASAQPAEHMDRQEHSTHDASQPDPTTQQLQPEQEPQASTASAPAVPHESQPENMSTEALPSLPLKRPYDALVMMYTDQLGHIHHLHQVQDPEAWHTFGPANNSYYNVYLTTEQRQLDVAALGKSAYESDTSDDSDTDIETKQADNNPQQQPQAKAAPLYKQGLTRQELKAVDREIPWRVILQMPQQYIEKFLGSIDKETSSWSEWQSVEPLNDTEAQEVLNSPILSKRIIPSRACYRDKSCGVGELRAKCRIVALGHLDPDLGSVSRSAATPGRLGEHMILAMLVAGMNGELFGSGLRWFGWVADAATAFLQGVQDASERKLPIFMKPPVDGLINMTNHWKSKLYRVRGNIYGLCDAPLTWYKEVSKRLLDLNYQKHSFDHCVFYKVNEASSEICSIILVYVDDFLGIYNQNYNLDEVHQQFRWGSIAHLEKDVPQTFKGKEVTVKQKPSGRYYIAVTMNKFLKGLTPGFLPRGRGQQGDSLTTSEQKELRSICGCLQWAATQCRPDVASLVSLTPHGSEAKLEDLKNLFEAISYLQATSEDGIIFEDLPFGQDSVILAYSDASFANARKSGSQIGVLVTLTTAQAASTPTAVTLLDWRSTRSPRVCRSTLAAEATAADDAADRAAFANMFASEFVHLTPAHRAGCRLAALQAVDAKSLFDAVLSAAPSLQDKRTLVSIRAIQETITGKELKWIPTEYQFSDCLTKVDRMLRQVFRAWLQKPRAVLMDSPEARAYAAEIGLGDGNAKRKHTSESSMQAIS